MQSQEALSITELVLNASFLVQCVMLFLLALSIISWTIIFSRNNQYRIGRAKADEFEDRFWSGIDLNNLYQDCMKKPNDLVGLEVIYSAGFKEFVRLVNSGPADQDVVMDGTYRQMKVACSREVELLENHLPTLATIGSISPYIGLFGTVWGIMHAFVSLASVKNATLAMVAPPIAEALIATAMGLFAAIPAVMSYNRFVSRVEALENRYYNFMDEFSTILNRRLVTIRSQLNRSGAYATNQMPNNGQVADGAVAPQTMGAEYGVQGGYSGQQGGYGPSLGMNVTQGQVSSAPAQSAPMTTGAGNKGGMAKNLNKKKDSEFNATTYERERELERERERERERELREQERLAQQRERREREMREREQREREREAREAALLAAQQNQALQNTPMAPAAPTPAAATMGAAAGASQQLAAGAPVGVGAAGNAAMAAGGSGNVAAAAVAPEATKGLHAASNARPFNVVNGRNGGRPNSAPPMGNKRGATQGAGAAMQADAGAGAAANAAVPLGGVSASSNAALPPLNDPNLASSYRGVVPPRTNANLNNAQLPGGAAAAVKPNNMAYNGGAAGVKSEGPFYKAGVEFDRRQRPSYNTDEAPHYIAPGGQNQRRNQAPSR